MNFYTLAAREERELSKLRREWLRIEGKSFDDNVPNDIDEAFEEQLDRKFETTYRRAVRRMLIAREINEEMGLTQQQQNKRMFFITIRPKCDKITFNEFHTMIEKLVQRNCFKTYKLSYEQKGTSEETLGHGFHVHMIAAMTQRSKGEIIRDIHSTMKSCTEKHCIQVDITYNGDEMFKKYCIEYESKDKHKEATKPWDAMWREKLQLEPFYDSTRAYQVQSGTQSISITEVKSEPLRLTFN